MSKPTQKRQAARLLNHLQKENDQVKTNIDICDINEACKVTKLAKATIYSKTSLGQIPCLSKGKPLLFSKKHLEMWIAAGRPKTNDMNQSQVILQQKGREKK